ncbi:MAG: RNA-directed DNA polymerase, partial [Candidatus Binatales bacterium]
MAIASAADLALLRVNCGLIAQVTDPVISDRVCSYRLAPSANSKKAWAFRSSKESWKSFTTGGIAILERAERPFMCRTDVTKFYPSICLDLLRGALLKRGCDASVVRRVTRVLESWGTLDGLPGLPIGPEGSAVLGNFFLDPVDRSIIAAGADHRRYGDDILIFTEGRSLSEALVALLDSELSSLRLVRSEEKTEYFEDPEDAKENLRDAKIDYWEGGAGYFPWRGTQAIRQAFDEDILNSPEVRPSRFRWILKYLKNRTDAYRCHDLAARRDLMNIDPKVSCDYLTLAKSKKRVLEESMKLLSEKPEPHFEALAFHTLLAMSHARTGVDEARE